MLDYSYYMPTKIVWGRNSISKNYGLIQDLGKKAAIVTGSSGAAKSGALADVVAALGENGQEFQVFSGVVSDPPSENILDLSQEIKSYSPDFLIAIGGGSVIDAAKVISFLLTNGISKEIIWQNISIEPLALVAVVTTAGTGSEVTPYAVLTDYEQETKRSVASDLIYPNIAFLDPRYTESMPYSLALDTAVDALSHLIEGLFAKKANNMSDHLAIKGLKLWSEGLSGLISGEISTKQRDSLLAASLFGGLTIAKTGTTLVHALGYSLTYYHNLTHGKANGLLLGFYLEYMQKFSPQKTAMVLEILGFKDLSQFRAVFQRFYSIKLDLTTREIALYVEKALKSRNVDNTVGEISAFVLADILERSLVK